MLAMLQPIALLLIIVAGYLFKRNRLFGPRDYRIVQVALFDLVLPGAIVYSFAKNPHDISLLWLSAYGFTFLMFNGTGLNIGCFCFPVVQAFLGNAAVVPAAMFDIGNCVMVAAGTNVMTQTLLHIQPGRTLAEQHAGDAPTLPYSPPTDRDAKRLARRALPKTIARGVVGAVPVDVYMLLFVLTVAGWSVPTWLADMFAPFANANACVAMLMVGMLMDLPANKRDLFSVLQVIVWRLPFGIAFGLAAWYLLPFSPMIREATLMCCLAPIAVFSTLFTDEVLGNAKLAGFSLTVTAVISLLTMTGAHALIATGVL